MTDSIIHIHKAFGHGPGAPPRHPDLRALREIVLQLDQADVSIADALVALEIIELAPDTDPELPENDSLREQIGKDLDSVEDTLTTVADTLWALKLETGLE